MNDKRVCVWTSLMVVWGYCHPLSVDHTHSLRYGDVTTLPRSNNVWVGGHAGQRNTYMETCIHGSSHCIRTILHSIHPHTCIYIFSHSHTCNDDYNQIDETFLTFNFVLIMVPHQLWSCMIQSCLMCGRAMCGRQSHHNSQWRKHEWIHPPLMIITEGQ